MSDMAANIEAFFLKNGKWELTVVPDGSPYLIPGRWLEIADSNYAFRPVDLVEALHKQDTKS
jgi:hypothetical protein